MQFLKRSVDKAVLRQILNSFTDLTDITVSYFDALGVSVAGCDKEMCHFCSEIRKLPDIYASCVKCDREAFKKAEEMKGLYIYKCHMNLWEAAIPIFIQNNIAGFLMLGQIKGAGTDSENDRKNTFTKLKERFSEEEITQIERKYEKIQTMEISKIEAAARMLEMITSYIANTEVIHVYDMEAVEKAKNYIDSNITEPISTSIVAKAVKHNASYLSSLFKRETGLTITEYIEKQRLDIAKHSLTMTTMAVKEISCQVGYPDQNYFSRVFKKHIGMSPLSYRIKYKKLC